MATRPKRVWKGARRRLLVATRKHLDRLVADRDKQTAKALAGKTPLYLALPASAVWDEVHNLITLIAAAVVAVA